MVRIVQTEVTIRDQSEGGEAKLVEEEEGHPVVEEEDPLTEVGVKQEDDL